MISVVWMPTFRCNLVCSYCSARRLPFKSHGGKDRELQAAEWVEIFNSCPLPIKHVAITGGEPSIYSGLKEVLDNTTFKFKIDTNLRTNPREWLCDDVVRLRAVNAGLQFHPEHPEALSYWKHLKWIKDTLSESAQVVCANVVLWRDLPEQRVRAKEIAESLGCENRPSTMCAKFLFNDKTPIDKGRYAGCGAGATFVVILPDASVYRCIGHAYYEIDMMGNVKRDGWKILHEEQMPCETLLCTSCDMVTKYGYKKE